MCLIYACLGVSDENAPPRNVSIDVNGVTAQTANIVVHWQPSCITSTETLVGRTDMLVIYMLLRCIFCQ